MTNQQKEINNDNIQNERLSKREPCGGGITGSDLENVKTEAVSEAIGSISKANPNYTVLTATKGTFSGETKIVEYEIPRTGIYLCAYQIGVGSIGANTRGILVEFRKNDATIGQTTMRNYMPGQGNPGAMQTMSCVWVGALSAGNRISVYALSESQQMEIQKGSMTVLEIPQIVSVAS